MSPIDQLKAVLCDPTGKCCIDGSDEDRAIIDRALQALAQTEQEELIQFKDGKWSYVRKPWVGLTDEDKANICMQGDFNNWHDEQVIDAVETQLKEKNT